MKTRSLLVACLGLLALACSSSRTPAREALEPPIRVLILGDSISIGYTRAVADLLGDEAIVFRPTNARGGAENCAGTNNGVQHLERWLAYEGGGFDVIHFNFGLHDLKRVHPQTGKNSNQASDPHQASPETYREQLEAITRRLSESGARLIFASTTPVPEGGVRPHREPSDVLLYNDLARQVMGSHGVPVNDLYGFIEPRLSELQKPVDVHFTPAGSLALAEAVARAIRAEAGWL